VSVLRVFLVGGCDGVVVVDNIVCVVGVCYVVDVVAVVVITLLRCYGSVNRCGVVVGVAIVVMIGVAIWVLCVGV